MICKHDDLKIIASYGGTSLNKCPSCGLIRSNKYLKSFNPKKIYNGYYRKSVVRGGGYHNEIVGRFVFGIEYTIKALRFFRAFKLYTINIKAETILDIGCGRGYTLYFLKTLFDYKRTVGTQIERNSYEYAKNKLGLEVYNRDLLQLRLKKNLFDLVTIWHVLEHVNEPEKYIKEIHRLLKRGGKLVVEVPNYDSWTRRFTGKYWLGLDLKYHLYFFDLATLANLLKKYGFIIEKQQSFSFEYSAFISVQSIISWFTQTDHLFFNFIQTGKFQSKIILHALMFLFLYPLSMLFNIFLYKSKYGEVILVIAKKSDLGE